MRVICPHNNQVHPRTADAIARYAPETVYLENTGLDGYDENISAYWDGSDDLVVIEQDKEITDEVLPAFRRCNQDWCSFAYRNFPEPYRKRVYTGLGCSFYSATIQRLVPPSEFTGPDPAWHPECKLCDGKGCWRTLDTRIAVSLVKRGIVTHVHGEIAHHHEYPEPVQWVRELVNTFKPDERLLQVASVCPACRSSLMFVNAGLNCSKCDFATIRDTDG